MDILVELLYCAYAKFCEKNREEDEVNKEYNEAYKKLLNSREIDKNLLRNFTLAQLGVIVKEQKDVINFIIELTKLDW